MLKNRIEPILATALEAAHIGAGYTEINPNGTEEPCFMIRLTNSTAGHIDISFDGVHSHEVLLPGSSITLNGQTNSGPNNQVANWPRNMIVWASSTDAGADGYVILSGYYQPQA